MFIKMYSKGVTTREIADMVERMYDHYYSPTTVSNITKRTEHLVEKFHERKFKHSQYVCVFLDALTFRYAVVPLNEKPLT